MTAPTSNQFPHLKSCEWRDAASMTVERCCVEERSYVSAAALDRTKMVVVGGVASPNQTAGLYDFKRNSWYALPDIPIDFTNGVVTIDRKIYVVGFVKGTVQDELVGMFMVLDTENDFLEWQPLNPAGYSASCAVASVGKKIYVFGGNYIDGEGKKVDDNAVNVYDVVGENWDLLPKRIPTARFGCVAVAIDDKIYLMGGKTNDGTVVSAVDIFDSQGGFWTKAKDMPGNRSEFAAVAIGQYILIIGGFVDDKDQRPLPTVLYSATTNEYYTGVLPPMGRYQTASAVLDGYHVYVAGGRIVGGNKSTGDVKTLHVPQFARTHAQALVKDGEKGQDKLDVEVVAKALADSIASVDLEPPFTLGILGSWGSGKSFMFHLIKQHLQRIQEKPVQETTKNFRWVGHIFVIEFSAWTYSKENLWASLMYRILYDLNSQLDLEKRLGEELLRDGVSTVKIMEQLSKGEIEYLKTKMNGGEEKAKAAAENIRNEVRLQRGKVTIALIRAINKEYKNDREKLLGLKQEFAMGYTEQKTKGKVTPGFSQLLKDAFESARKEKGKEWKSLIEVVDSLVWYKRLWKKFRAGNVSWCWIVMAALAILLTIVVLMFLERTGLAVRGWHYLSSTWPFIPTAWKKFISTNEKLKTWTGIFESAWNQEVDHSGSWDIEETPLMEAQNKNGESLAQLKGKITTLEEQLYLVTGESISSIVRDRLESGDYETHLGVVHRAQQDLDRLSQGLLSKKHDPNERNPFPRGSPRIVLFIDDLDRCSPTKVVEVLEALQLLVKTKLFVAVVAADPRFVTLALENAYRGVIRTTEYPTALDYIEKIIQLMFWIPPIDDPEVMENYIKSQMHSDGHAESTLNDETVATNWETLRNRVTVQRTVNSGNTWRLSRLTIPSLSEVVPIDDVPSEEKVLEFTSDDSKDLAKACLLAHVTPRSAKRLVNTFKILKYIWYLKEDFHDDNIKRLCLVLLALSSSASIPLRLGLSSLFGRIEELRSPPANCEDLSKVIMSAGLGKDFETFCNRTEVAEYFKKVKFDDEGWSVIRKEILLIQSFAFAGLPATGSSSELHPVMNSMPNLPR